MTEHLFNGVVVVVLPIITSSLGLSLAQAGALASARTLLAGVASFPSGFFADLASRRNILLGTCIALIGLASLGLSAAWTFPALMLFMALGGFGGGWFHPQSLAILSTKYRDQKAFALGVHDSSANLGEVIGPLTIGFLLNFFDWRTSLQIWAIPGLCIGVLYATFGREGNLAVPRPRDYRRAVWEDVLKNKAVFSLVAVSTLRAMGQTALAAFLPLYLSLHLKLPASIAGAYMSILFLFAGMAPACVGWVSDRLGHKRLIAVFSVLSFVAIGYSAPRLGILAYCWPGGARRFAVGASTRDRIGSYVGCTATPVRKHCGLNLWRQYGRFIPGSACRRANCGSIRIADCTHKHCGFSAPGGHNLLPHSSGAEN